MSLDALTNRFQIQKYGQDQNSESYIYHHTSLTRREIPYAAGNCRTLDNFKSFCPMDQLSAASRHYDVTSVRTGSFSRYNQAILKEAFV